ncbi:hypothetical protein B0H19DRAFT_1373977 [Mycena capillaripes]|nr:hypothetical protein B0H19DRAFT_1373977 [Mycena capillaripes]
MASRTSVLYTKTFSLVPIILLGVKDAESHLGTTARNSAATIPAYFNGSQRPAIKDAGATSMERPSSESFDIIVEEVSSRWPVTIHLTSEAFEYRLVNDSAQEISRNISPQPLPTASSVPLESLPSAPSPALPSPAKPRPLSGSTASSRPRAVSQGRRLRFSCPGRSFFRDTPAKTQDLLLLNVAPFSLKTAGPASTSPTYEGERARTEDTNFLGKFELSPLTVVSLSSRGSTNDKGRMSKEADDNPLEPSAYNLRNSLNDEKRLTNLPTPDALLSQIVLIFFLVIMQCRILIAFAVSCLTLSVAAAPVADSSILDRTLRLSAHLSLSQSQAVECTLASEDLKTVHSHTLFTAKPSPSSHPFGPCNSLIHDALENVTRAVTVSSRRFFVELYF